MNVLPFCGYFFYGGTSTAETAAFFCSFGLLAIAPVVTVFGILRQMLMQEA